jgi:hypothetical protein
MQRLVIFEKEGDRQTVFGCIIGTRASPLGHRFEAANPAFASRNTECSVDACGRCGTTLRPSFADQIFPHILRTLRSAVFPQAEAFCIRRVLLVTSH